MRLIRFATPLKERLPTLDVLGIDVSKADFHACLLQDNRQSKKSFPNAPAGYRQLHNWLRNRGVLEIHACMEATGAYWLGLAVALYESGETVSVVNPSRTAMFARSQLRRTKTDRVDSEMIAQFCQTQSPELWRPPAPETLELRGLLTYREQLVNERVRLKQIVKQIHVGKDLQRLHVKQLKSLDRSIAVIEKQLRTLLTTHEQLGAQVATLESVSGFGFITAVAIVAQLPIERLRNAKAAAAYAGLTPSERQSGTSVNGRVRICKTGNATLRRDLYMPALVAMRHNPILRAFAQRLKEKGKAPKVIIIAVMRKLVVLAFTLLTRLTAAPLVADAI